MLSLLVAMSLGFGCLPISLFAQLSERVEVRHVTRLVDAAGRAGVGLTSIFAMDRSHRLYLADAFTGASISVFDTTGALLKKFGGKGAGPGEFGFIQFMEFDASGRLHVFDITNGRRSIFSPELDLIETRPFPLAITHGGVVRLPDGSFVVNQPRTTAREIGKPVHVVDANGRIVRSMGEVDGPIRPDRSMQSFVRFLAPGGPGLIWVGHMNQYVLELLDSTGTVQRRFSRNVPWFSAWTRFQVPSLQNPPLARMAAITRDSADRVWVAVNAADENWRDAVKPSSGRFGGYRATPPQDYWDSVIEVIDGQSGRVQASLRLDSYVVAFVGDHYLISYGEQRDGEPFLELSKLEFTNPQ
jgi:hypothetical protein